MGHLMILYVSFVQQGLCSIPPHDAPHCGEEMVAGDLCDQRVSFCRFVRVVHFIDFGVGISIVDYLFDWIGGCANRIYDEVGSVVCSVKPLPGVVGWCNVGSARCTVQLYIS